MTRSLIRDSSAGCVTVPRCLLVLLVAACVGGCASLPPRSDFPKTVSSALAQPAETRIGRQSADAARHHGGTSADGILAAGTGGCAAAGRVVDAVERSDHLRYFFSRAAEAGKPLDTALLGAADRGERVPALVDDGEA